MHGEREKRGRKQEANMEKIIFAIDDNGTYLTIIDELLENRYSVITLASAAQMLVISSFSAHEQITHCCY